MTRKNNSATEENRLLQSLIFSKSRVLKTPKEIHGIDAVNNYFKVFSPINQRTYEYPGKIN